MVSTIMQVSGWYSVSTGPGEPLRTALGWTPLLHTPSSGVWLFRGAVRGEQLLAALVSSVDWVVRGTYRTAWAVEPRCPLLICVWAEGSCWATYRVSLLEATPGFVEGHRTSHGTLVCRWGCADVCELELLRWVGVVRSLAQR